MNPIFIKIGSVQIYWYSVILLIAFIIGIVLAIKQACKEGIDKEVMYDYVFYLIPICLIGARIYYILFNLDYYLANITSIIKVWEGGLAIHGGILFGLIYTYFFTKKKNIPFFQFCDILVVSLILGQVIGRWGNFMNSEAYGPVTTLATLKNFHIPNFIIQGIYINGNYHHPTFLYESVWNFIGFILMLILRKMKNYLIWYGIGRFFIEGLRQDSLMLKNIKIAQLVSIGMVFVGIFLILKIKKNKIDTKKQK